MSHQNIKCINIISAMVQPLINCASQYKNMVFIADNHDAWFVTLEAHLYYHGNKYDMKGGMCDYMDLG